MIFNQYRTHSDHRRSGSYDIFPILPGDMNFTIHAPKVKPEELHRHLIQTDYFTVVKGSVLFWLQYEDGKNEKFILTDQDKKTLSIPPGVWHGYMALKKDTIMVFYITQKFNPNDEFRKKCDPKEWKLPRKA